MQIDDGTGTWLLGIDDDDDGKTTCDCFVNFVDFQIDIYLYISPYLYTQVTCLLLFVYLWKHTLPLLLPGHDSRGRRLDSLLTGHDSSSVQEEATIRWTVKGLWLWCSLSWFFFSFLPSYRRHADHFLFASSAREWKEAGAKRIIIYSHT